MITAEEFKILIQHLLTYLTASSGAQRIRERCHMF